MKWYFLLLIIVGAFALGYAVKHFTGPKKVDGGSAKTETTDTDKPDGE